MNVALAHDTDPAPANPGGNGHDSKYPCAIHAAQLVETREVLKELREAVKGIARTQSDENERRSKWEEDVGFALVEIRTSVDGLSKLIGTPPDQSTGTPGTGMRGQIAAAINASIKGAARREMPSLMDADESEVTSVMDRDALVMERRVAKARAHKMTIAAYSSAIVVVIGAITAGIVAIIQALP